METLLNHRHLSCVLRHLSSVLCLLSFSLLSSVSLAAPNVAPTVTVVSAAMRAGTTLMDITYKVTDPDDPTVKVRALAFVNGTHSFANVIRPVTWAEGTQVNIGDAITTGVNHTLTWDVKADWSIDLGNINVEILARDGRGLLPLDWITIPAAGENPAVTISSNVPTDAQLLDALFWLYADGDAELLLTNGTLTGTAASGMYNGEWLASGTSLSSNAPPAIYLYRRMNLSRATVKEKDVAILARTAVCQTALHAANRPWNENELGMDPRAVTKNVISVRWVKNTYADGAITMGDRFTGLMWVYDATAGGKMWQSSCISYCANLVYAGYDNWFSPSLSQLVMMYSQKGFFIVDAYPYWSSTGGGGGAAYNVNMADGSTNGMNGNLNGRVWPVCVGP